MVISFLAKIICLYKQVLKGETNLDKDYLLWTFFSCYSNTHLYLCMTSFILFFLIRECVWFLAFDFLSLCKEI